MWTHGYIGARMNTEVGGCPSCGRVGERIYAVVQSSAVGLYTRSFVDAWDAEPYSGVRR